MLNNSGRRIKKWLTIRLPFLWLTLSIFFTSYFPAVCRYSINTLFNSEKRGYFDFLFVSFQLRDRTDPHSQTGSLTGKSNWWIRWFGIILFVCYILHVVSEALWISCEKQAKQNFKKIIDDKLGKGEATEWTKSFADRIVSDLVSFFSVFCELFIDLWAVISINRAREVKRQVLGKTFCCLLVMICGVLVMEYVAEQREAMEEKPKFSLVISKVQQQLVFSELSIIFTALYFLFFPRDSEVINAVLLGFNVSSVLGKLRKFIRVVPPTISTYKMWKRRESVHVTTPLD